MNKFAVYWFTFFGVSLLIATIVWAMTGKSESPLGIHINLKPDRFVQPQQ